MTVYTVYTKGNDKVWLYSDDTYTLALSDCSDPTMADETTETTPKMLADIFSSEALEGLLQEMYQQCNAGIISIHELDGTRYGKLGDALNISYGRTGQV